LLEAHMMWIINGLMLMVVFTMFLSMVACPPPKIPK